MEICEQCGRACDTPCAAVMELDGIYRETQADKKRKLISRLRKMLDITDAEPANDLRLLAQKVIKKVPELRYIADFGVKIGYVRSYERKTKGGKAVYADCRKVSIVYGAYLPYDFIVTFYELNAGDLTDEQQAVLMWHELKHIGISERGFAITPHDVEDFHSIIDAHGARWSEQGTEVMDILG